jgi:hypothetical protein
MTSRRRRERPPTPKRASPEIGSHVAYQTLGAGRNAPLFGGAVVFRVSVDVTGLLFVNAGIDCVEKAQVAPVGRFVHVRPIVFGNFEVLGTGATDTV